jgi:hypothetical protein
MGEIAAGIGVCIALIGAFAFGWHQGRCYEHQLWVTGKRSVSRIDDHGYVEVRKQ